jgi:hypothetical protein
MVDEMHEDFEANAPIFDMRAARDKFRTVVDTSRKGRAARHQVVTESVDRRTLRKTGRTAQFNFKARPDLQSRAKTAAERAGMSLAQYMEGVLEAAFAAEDGGKDA